MRANPATLSTPFRALCVRPGRNDQRSATAEQQQRAARLLAEEVGVAVAVREPLGLAGDEEDAAGAMAVDEALEGGAVQEQRRRVGIPGAVLQIALAAVQDMERAAGVEAQAVVGLIATVDDEQVPGLPVAIDQGLQPV